MVRFHPSRLGRGPMATTLGFEAREAGSKPAAPTEGTAEWSAIRFEPGGHRKVRSSILLPSSTRSPSRTGRGAGLKTRRLLGDLASLGHDSEGEHPRSSGERGLLIRAQAGINTRCADDELSWWKWNTRCLERAVIAGSNPADSTEHDGPVDLGLLIRGPCRVQLSGAQPRSPGGTGIHLRFKPEVLG